MPTICSRTVCVQVSIGIDPYEIFAGADWALMVGASPRGPGMERADLIQVWRLLEQNLPMLLSMLMPPYHTYDDCISQSASPAFVLPPDAPPPML